MGGERRRQKSLRNGVHHANAVVWGPVYRTHLFVHRQLAQRQRQPRGLRVEVPHLPGGLVSAATRRDGDRGRGGDGSGGLRTTTSTDRSDGRLDADGTREGGFRWRRRGARWGDSRRARPRRRRRGDARERCERAHLSMASASSRISAYCDRPIASRARARAKKPSSLSSARRTRIAAPSSSPRAGSNDRGPPRRSVLAGAGDARARCRESPARGADRARRRERGARRRPRARSVRARDGTKAREFLVSGPVREREASGIDRVGSIA